MRLTYYVTSVTLTLCVLTLFTPGNKSASLTNNKKSLVYLVHVESNVLDQERINSTIKLKVEPVEKTDDLIQGQHWYMAQLLQVSHEILSRHDTLHYPQNLLQNVFYFSTSPTGLVNRVYYQRDDEDELIHLKKYLISAMSGHLQDHKDNEWEYKQVEVDHAGEGDHHYRAKRTVDGKEYHRIKDIKPDMPHSHEKRFTINSRGVVTSVSSLESLLMIDNSETEDMPDSSDDVPKKDQHVENNIHMRLMEENTLKHPRVIRESKLNALVNDSVQLDSGEISYRKYTLKETEDSLQEGLQCARKHQRTSGKRAECVMEMTKKMQSLDPEELTILADKLFKHDCKKEHDKWCQHDRDLMIDIISRIGTSTAQHLMLKHIFSKNEESEVRRCLFHFTVLSSPTERAVDTVANLCFGAKMKHHGVLMMHGNQKRACMTLGSMLKGHQNMDQHKTQQLLNHLHTWLETDKAAESRHHSGILRDYDDHAENMERQHYIHAKSVLLHALGNAAHPSSRDYIAAYAEPNSGHGGTRHTAMKALRHYTCKESATLLLNVTLNDEDLTVQSTALKIYKKHPRGGELSHTDENLLLSKNHTMKSHLRAKRSKICDIIEKLTLDFRLELPGFDWSKKVGNSFLGSSFGAKVENYGHIHLSPVAMFFEVSLYAGTWIDAWVKLFKKTTYDIFRAELCFYRSFRMYNISNMLDFNMRDILSEFEAFNEMHTEVVEPMVTSINDYYQLLGTWQDPLESIQMGCGKAYVMGLIEERKEDIIKDLKEVGQEIIEEHFDWLLEFIDNVKEFKAEVINKKEEIVDTVQEWKETSVDYITDLYQSSMDIAQISINEYLMERGVSFQLEILDECLKTVTFVQLVRDPNLAGQEIVNCLKERLEDEKDIDFGLMGQMNKILRTVRNMQERFYNISSKVDSLRRIVENTNGGEWRGLVQRLLERLQGFTDDMATSMLDFLNGNMDDMAMNLQYVITSMDEAVQFLAHAAKVVKEAPVGALMDIDRSTTKIRVAQVLYNKLQSKFIEKGSELQGKLSSWMEAGMEHDNLIRGLQKVIQKLNTTLTRNQTEEIELNTLASPRDRVIKMIKDTGSIEDVTVLLEDLVGDIKSVRYLADGYKDSFVQVNNGMVQAEKSYEGLKRGIEAAKALIQKIFGVKFHPLFPKQVKTNCTDACGGCGIYPNIMRGRSGAQMLAEIGHPIVSPFDARVFNISDDEVILYPFSADMSEYEIVISFIQPAVEVLNETDGLVADAGMVIGYAVESDCQPNFIHVSMRSLNSTTNPEPKSTNQSSLIIKNKKDVGCGTPDIGEYKPVEDFSDTEDPNPKYIEGCSHAEFEHIGNYFNMEAIANKTEQFLQNVTGVLEDITDYINETVRSIPEMEEVVVEDMEAMKTEVVGACKTFSKNIFDIATQSNKMVTYDFDDHGIRRKNVSFKEFPNIPVITDYFNTMNFTVEEFGEFLQNADLDHLYDSLMEYAEELAAELDMTVCEMLNKVKPLKLRIENLKENGDIDGAKDFLKAQLQSIKAKGCDAIIEAMSKGESHFCEVQDYTDCQSIQCMTTNKFDNKILEVSVSLAFDPCTSSVDIIVKDKPVTIEYNDRDEKVTIIIPITVIEHLNISAHISVVFDSDEAKVTITLGACHLYEPICFGTSPLFSDLTFDIKDKKNDGNNDKVCIRLNKDETPCSDDIGKQSYRGTPGQLDALKQVKSWKMGEFLYSMDRLNISRKEINHIIETSRVSVLTTLQSTTALKSSIAGKEIYELPDLRADDSLASLTFDIPFFNLACRIPGPIKITITAGGEIQLGVDFALKVLSSNITVTPKATLLGYAEADGKLSVVVTAVGLVLRGILLETTFFVDVEVKWPQYPITINLKLGVTLIPLGVEFRAYFKILFIKIEFQVFEWKAPKLEGIIYTNQFLIHDRSAPDYEWDNMSCRVEQSVGRHWSDPAFYIEAPFYDPQSVLTVRYSVGTYRDGVDVQNWADMAGVAQTVPVLLKVTGVPLHFTISAENTCELTSVVHCILDTYDVTPATGRFEASHIYTSNPSKLVGTLMVIEDSPLIEEQYMGIGVGYGSIGDQVVEWHLFHFQKDVINEEGEGVLSKYSAPRPGKLSSTPVKTIQLQHDTDCAQQCIDMGDSCVSFDFDYGSNKCDLQWTIEGKAADLVLSGAYHNFEKLGAGYTAYFAFDDLELIHGETYYLNSRITNVMGYESYITSHGIIFDSTPPMPGPIGNATKDEMRHDNCSAAITHWERCDIKEVTSIKNHRFIIDGPGAATVFNGNFPKTDMLYTISNHYLTANWDGFHDDETDIWGYTWAIGTTVCGSDIQEWDDPHSHLADKSYWTHQGLASELSLNDGQYYASVQALNNIEFGGALVTTVCHSIPITVDTSSPWLDYVEDVFYDEEFDLMAIYYKASDPESGIQRTDVGLGETKHDVFIKAYSQHDPLHDGYEMVSLDGIELPAGVPVWVRVRVVNNVDMVTADHAEEPLMMDPTPPEAGSILDGDKDLVDMKFQPYDDRMCVQWYDWFDPESGIDRFLWGIGSTPNDTDVMEFMEFDHYTKKACVNIDLNHTSTYYNIIMAYNKAVNSRATLKVSDGITVDITNPLRGWVHDGEDPDEDIMYSSQAASIYTTWGDFVDEESGINKYTITVLVDNEIREVFEKPGDAERFEDHTLHLQHGDNVKVQVESVNGAESKNESESSGFVIDLTPPDIVFLKDHPLGLRYQKSDTEIYGNWLFEDNESQIKEYLLRIIKQKGKTNYHFWPQGGYETIVPSGSKEVEITIPDLKLENGLKYILEVTAVNNAELGSKQESMGVTVDTTPPYMTKVYIGSFGANERINEIGEIIHEDHHGIQASWVGYDHESGITHFMVAVGTSPGDDSVSGGYQSFGVQTDGYIDGLGLNVTAETGVVYYLSIYAINGAGENCEFMASKPIHVYGENTPGIVYDGREMAIDADYTTDTTTVAMNFQGFESPACGLRRYEWALGSQPGFSDIMQYTDFGIVMLNDSHGMAELHLSLKHGDVLYASVRAHTGSGCIEAIIHSCSDGILVDVHKPEVVFLTLGVAGNITVTEVLYPVYQQEHTSIAMEWNATDENSGLINDTWMAGSLPLSDNKHQATVTTDQQIPLRAVSMVPGETTMFTLSVTDMAGNIREAVSPTLTVDTTEPIVEGFHCTKFMSIIRTEIECQWTISLDEESPILQQIVSVGENQMDGDIVPYTVIPYGSYTWRKSLHKVLDKLQSLDTIVITLQVENSAGLITSVFYDVFLDWTPPDIGQVYITTPVKPGEQKQPKLCQQSLTTMEVSWIEFQDQQTQIHSYEVAVGSHEGGYDISNYKNVGNVTSVFLDQLTLLPGTEVHASVRAVNNGGLVSGTSTSSIHISPNPEIELWDGLVDRDIDFQNDLSTLSGQVKLTHHCPIVEAYWEAYDILGNNVVNETEFFKYRFANDELELENFRTYFVVVTLVDGINRTLRAKSDGVMTVIQPPKPGEVRDGPFYGEDRNYQESTTELSVNWDPFGDDDDPLQTIVGYEVAIGDNTAFPETRTNIHYFVDAGLNLNYTFYNLRLTPKAFHYYATVKGHSASGASIQSVSNGIKVGYSEGMETGDVYILPFTHNDTSISFYWNHFKSDFLIVHYQWGIGLKEFVYENMTLPCQDIYEMLHKWARVQSLFNVKRDTFAEKHDMSFIHSRKYFVIVVAEDQAGQCITSKTQSFLVDLTPPEKGSIDIEGLSTRVQYTTKQNRLTVEWKDYKDEESGIKDFLIQLKSEPDCNGSTAATWISVSRQLDVKDTNKHTFMALNLQPHIPYRIVMSVTNQAGSTTDDWSDPIFLDTTQPTIGVVKDGLDWTKTRHYQSSTTKLEAIFAVSPKGTTLDCPMIEAIIPENNGTLWQTLNGYIIEKEGSILNSPHIEYMKRNVMKENSDTLIKFHYNITTSHLEGGALISEPMDLIEGDYTINLKAPPGEKVIFSITLSNGWMDEFTDFQLPVVEDPMSDEEFLEQAKDGDIDFDRDLDVSAAPVPSTTQRTTETPEVTDVPINMTNSSTIHRDGFNSNAIGLHILGFPFGNKSLEWLALIWTRDVNGIKSNWIYLNSDPTSSTGSYVLSIQEDVTAENAGWNVYFNVNGTELSEINGVYLPENYTIKMRHWTYNQHQPAFNDPFNPFHTEALIKQFTVPLPKTRPCQFGKAFYDMESGINEIYVGVSNSSALDDNIVGYHLYDKLCHSCALPCDHYKCSSSCSPELNDGYLFLQVHLDNLTLTLGDYETEEEIQVNLFGLDSYDYENSGNETAFFPNRYYILLNVINEAGLEIFTSSPGIMIDVTPPMMENIVATDPEYDPLAPALYQWTNKTLSAWWTFQEMESFITEYKLAIGTSQNGTDIMNFTSVETDSSVRIDMEDDLIVGQTYFITVEAINAAGLSTFASTTGITVHVTPPDVSNITYIPVNATLWPGDKPENQVYLTEYQESLAINIQGKFEDNVNKLVWCIGESTQDTYITSCTEIDKRYRWHELDIRKNGYFWYSGVQSDTHLTWLAQKTGQINMTLEGEYVDPGSLWLEPGQCVYHHLYVQNLAHLSSLVSHKTVCIKREIDHIIPTISDFYLSYTYDDTNVTISGTGESGSLITAPISGLMNKRNYHTSANVTYKPYIVDPNDTINSTSRIMTNRLKRYTNFGVTISPVTEIQLLEPIEISISFEALIEDNANESVALMYWDTDTQLWYNVEESSERNSSINMETLEITGWFSGSINQGGIPEGKLEIQQPFMIGLFVVSLYRYNSPPTLLTKRLVTKANTPIETTLQYHDVEGDKVTFHLISHGSYGQATLTENGVLSFIPESYFYGREQIKVKLKEVDVPLGVESHTVEDIITINVLEVPFAPVLFLNIDVDGQDKYSTGEIEVMYEANTTSKASGYIYICDYNPDDILDLLIKSSNSENITLKVNEVTKSEENIVKTLDKALTKSDAQLFNDNSEIMSMHQCFEKNYKVYSYEVNTSMEYHGYDRIVLIGKDNHPLFSQPITINMYTLCNPCGEYGECDGQGDQDCQSKDRAYSFEGYSCSCYDDYTGQYCDTFSSPGTGNAIAITISLCALTIFIVAGLLVAYKSKKKPNKVEPQMELYDIDETKQDGFGALVVTDLEISEATIDESNDGGIATEVNEGLNDQSKGNDEDDIKKMEEAVSVIAIEEEITGKDEQSAGNKKPNTMKEKLAQRDEQIKQKELQRYGIMAKDTWSQNVVQEQSTGTAKGVIQVKPASTEKVSAKSSMVTSGKKVKPRSSVVTTVHK